MRLGARAYHFPRWHPTWVHAHTVISHCMPLTAVWFAEPAAQPPRLDSHIKRDNINTPSCSVLVTRSFPPKWASSLVFSQVCDSLNRRRNRQGLRLRHPPGAYVNGLLVPRGGAIEVDIPVSGSASGCWLRRRERWGGRWGAAFD